MKKNLIFFGLFLLSSSANATFEEAVKKFQDLTPNLKWSTFQTEQVVQELIKNSIRELFYKQIEIVLNISDKKSKSEILENLSEEKNKHEQAFQNFSQELRQFIQPDFLDKFCAELQERKEKFAPHSQLDWTKPCQKFQPFSEMSILAYGLEDQIRSRPDEIIQWDQMDSLLRESAKFYNQIDQKIKEQGFFKTINHHIHIRPKKLPWLVDLNCRNTSTWPLDLYRLEDAAFRPNAEGDITDKIKKEIAYQKEERELASIFNPFFDPHFFDHLIKVSFSKKKTIAYQDNTVKEKYFQWTKQIKSLPGSNPSEQDEIRVLHKLNFVRKLSSYSDKDKEKDFLKKHKYSTKINLFKYMENKKNQDRDYALQFMGYSPSPDPGLNPLFQGCFQEFFLYESFLEGCLKQIDSIDRKKSLNKMGKLNLNSSCEFKENIEKENARKSFKKDLKDEYQRIQKIKSQREKEILNMQKEMEIESRKKLKEDLVKQLGSQKKLTQEEEKFEEQKN